MIRHSLVGQQVVHDAATSLAMMAEDASALGLTPAFVMIAYLGVLLSIGIYAYLKSRPSDDDYYLAGRGQNFLVTALTIMATFFSSAALLGIPGAIYKDGVAFVFFALNLPLSGAAVYLLGSRVWKIGQQFVMAVPSQTRV